MNATAHDLLIRKLRSIAALNAAECAAVAELPIHVREVAARTDIVTEGERPSQCCLLIAGLVIRYKMTSRGQRQIVILHVPGDLPDLQSLHLTIMDHHMAALTPATVGMIPHKAIHDVNARFPRVAGALWRATLIDAALLRERVVSLGQRSAVNRMAHLLCETYIRLHATGQADGHVMSLPITQVELADMLGLSNVHMNRTIQELRARGLMVTDRDTITLPNWPGLVALAGFDPLFLHLDPQDPATPP